MAQQYHVVSAAERSEGQKNRYAREAMHVLRLIGEHIGATQEFTHVEAFDHLGDHTKRGNKARAEKKRITAALNFLLKKGLLEKCAGGHLCLSEGGYRILEEDDVTESYDYAEDDEDSYD